MAELAVGSVFAGHRIEAVAGRGGMGVVYLATHLALNRRVALKLIAPALADSIEFRERFKRESETAASLDHPNVIPIYHAGEEDGLLFITMRYIDGTDLRGLIQEGLDSSRVPPIVAQVAAALDAAHAGGLVHRDVKPANVLVATADGRDHVYLTDFGLTKHVGSQAGLTQAGTWVGTLDYVAPEQIENKHVDARSDVYSLGAVLYHALTGRVPFERDTDVAKMYAHLNDPPPVPSGTLGWLPPALDDVVRRAMAKSPDDRFPSAGDLGRAALAAVQGRAPVEPERSVAVGSAAGGVPTVIDSPTPPTQPVPSSQPTYPLPASQPPAAPPPPQPPRRSGRGLLLALVAVLILGGGAAAAVLVAGGSDDDGNGGTTTITDDTGTNGTGPERPTVAAADVRTVLGDYSSLYTAEDAQGLGALLTEDATRSNDGEVTNKQGAIEEYQSQFDLLESPVYTLDITSVEPGQGEATASARYTITVSGERRGSGDIDFHFVEENRELLIDEITIVGD